MYNCVQGSGSDSAALAAVEPLRTPATPPSRVHIRGADVFEGGGAKQREAVK